MGFYQTRGRPNRARSLRIVVDLGQPGTGQRTFSPLRRARPGACRASSDRVGFTLRASLRGIGQSANRDRSEPQTQFRSMWRPT